MIIHGETALGTPVPIKTANDGSLEITGTVTAVVDETTLAKEATLASVLANQTDGNQVIKTIQPTTFTPDLIRGTIGGGALANNADPNVTPPAAGTTIRMAPTRGAIFYGIGRVSFVACNGTSITIQLWFYDDVGAVWTKLGAAAAITVGTSDLGIVTVGAMTGCLLYGQITANTGVEKLAMIVS
jgi:hypothetical protein